MNWFLLTTIILLVYSVVVSFYCIKFAILIIKIEDSIETSLDKLDKRYASMDKIMQRPLFYDNQEIRSVMSDIDASREAILEVANSITGNFNSSQENKSDEG